MEQRPEPRHGSGCPVNSPKRYIFGGFFWEEKSGDNMFFFDSSLGDA